MFEVENTALLLLAGVLALAYAGYALAVRRIAHVQRAGLRPHSLPGQYGWFGALSAAVPALGVAALGTLLQLAGLLDVPDIMVVTTAMLVGAGGLGLGLRRTRPQLRARNVVEATIRWLLLGAALISILTTAGIILSVVFESVRFFGMVSFWEFVTGTQWAPDAAFTQFRGETGGPKAKFGAVPLFAGTFLITLIALAVAIPVGLLSAIFMSEYAPRSVRGIAKPALEVLAGIPTVVYGFFAAITVAPLLVDVAGALGLEASYNAALAPGLVMGVMIIPFISSLSDDVLSSVPQTMREGSLALGMTESETVRNVVVPAALPGIISASLLGMSRALGETMIVVMAAGLRPNLTWNPLEEMTTVTVRIVDALTGDQAFDSPETLSAFALGLVLFVITLVLNVISIVMVRRFRAQYEQA